MTNGNMKAANNIVRLKLSFWILTTTTVSLFLVYITAVSALLDGRALRLSSAPVTRGYWLLSNSFSRKQRHPVRTSTRRFSTVATNSLFRSTTDRGFNQDKPGVNDGDKIQLIRDESRSSFWSTSAQPDQVGEYDPSGERILTLPNVPTMDFDGPLPRGAYRTFGNPSYEPKPTCLLTVAVDVQPRDDKDSEEMNPQVIVKRMQQLIDAGLTTISLRLPDATTTAPTMNAWCQDWAEENVYGRLLRDTPASALSQTQLVVPMTLPMTSFTPDDTRKTARKGQYDDEDEAPVTATTIRKTVLGSLQRMGADCVDSLQLQCKLRCLPSCCYFDRTSTNECFDSWFNTTDVNDSQYHLDVLDYLAELQREGLIRSITGRNLPAELLEQAHHCGFHLDSNQLDGGSLLKPLEESSENNGNDIASRRRRRRPSLQETMSKTGTRLVLASPLAGGLLTERYLGKRLEPKPWEFASESERQQYFSKAVPRWFRQQQAAASSIRTSGRKRDTSRWSTYQQQLLEPLQDIAWKHCVSIAAVSLRYVLQSQQYQQLQLQRRYEGCPDDPFSLASVVISSRLGATCQNDENRWDRPQEWRQVFQFALDEEDMDRLRGIAFRRDEIDEDSDEAMLQKMMLDSWEQEYDEREMDRLEEEHRLTDHPPLDLNNRRLWL